MVGIQIIKADSKYEKYIRSFMINKIENIHIIKYNNKNVGIIEFTESDEQIHVEYINVKEEYRMNGIGKLVINCLKEKGKEIYGNSLVDSVAFWLNVGADFEGEEENIEQYKESTSCIPFFIC